MSIRKPLKIKKWIITYKLPEDRIKVTIISRKIISRYARAHKPVDCLSYECEAVEK